MNFLEDIDQEVAAELQAKHDEIDKVAESLKREKATSKLAELRSAVAESTAIAELAQLAFDNRFSIPVQEEVATEDPTETPEQESTEDQPQG